MDENMTLWPDDQPEQTGRDGSQALMEGRYPYFISRNLLFERPNLFRDHKTVLTDFIRASAEPVNFLTTNIDTVVSRRPPTVNEKLERLLRSLARRTQYQAGSVSLIHDRRATELYPLLRDAGVRDQAELKSLLGYADTRQLAGYSESSSTADAIIRIPGIIYVEALATSAIESRSAFVAMWFSAEMVEVFDSAIVPAIEANGYSAVRVDQREFNHRVDDEIISEIRKAKFVVSDFSCGVDGARGGVYFEAGFALALGKPVIFTVRKADLERVHFDTRQFNHIVWENADELREKLENRIGATVGPPTDAA